MAVRPAATDTGTAAAPATAIFVGAVVAVLVAHFTASEVVPSADLTVRPAPSAVVVNCTTSGPKTAPHVVSNVQPRGVRAVRAAGPSLYGPPPPARAVVVPANTLLPTNSVLYRDYKGNLVHRESLRCVPDDLCRRLYSPDWRTLSVPAWGRPLPCMSDADWAGVLCYNPTLRAPAAVCPTWTRAAEFSVDCYVNDTTCPLPVEIAPLTQSDLAHVGLYHSHLRGDNLPDEPVTGIEFTLVNLPRWYGPSEARLVSVFGLPLHLSQQVPLFGPEPRTFAILFPEPITALAASTGFIGLDRTVSPRDWRPTKLIYRECTPSCPCPAIETTATTTPTTTPTTTTTTTTTSTTTTTTTTTTVPTTPQPTTCTVLSGQAAYRFTTNYASWYDPHRHRNTTIEPRPLKLFMMRGDMGDTDREITQRAAAMTNILPWDRVGPDTIDPFARQFTPICTADTFESCSYNHTATGPFTRQYYMQKLEAFGTAYDLFYDRSTVAKTTINTVSLAHDTTPDYYSVEPTVAPPEDGWSKLFMMFNYTGLALADIAYNPFETGNTTLRLEALKRYFETAVVEYVELSGHARYNTPRTAATLAQFAILSDGAYTSLSVPRNIITAGSFVVVETDVPGNVPVNSPRLGIDLPFFLHHTRDFFPQAHLDANTPYDFSTGDGFAIWNNMFSVYQGPPPGNFFNSWDDFFANPDASVATPSRTSFHWQTNVARAFGTPTFYLLSANCANIAVNEFYSATSLVDAIRTGTLIEYCAAHRHDGLTCKFIPQDDEIVIRY